jgi:hypothetical protein
MTTQTEAERLAGYLDDCNRLDLTIPEAAAELRRLQHNNLVLMDALWKACGDDEEVVNGCIESQGELK